MTAPVDFPADFPRLSTRVTYPAGDVSGAGVLLAAPVLPDGRRALVADVTPFHPLDHTWPDQPADTGTVRIAGGPPLPVADCLTGAVGPDGVLHIAEDIPVRRGDDAWAWLVLHVLDESADPPSLDVAPGMPLAFEVDAARRAALSRAHTACHLMAFALNDALAPRWRKEVRTDALGRPDFDNLAMERSVLDVEGSVDEYRIGKSLRKKGFTPDGLAGDLDAVRDAVAARIATWTELDAPVRIDVPDDALTARRVWHCALPDGDAHIPCGGTHVRSLGELGTVTLDLELGEGGSEFTVRTRPSG